MKTSRSFDALNRIFFPYALVIIILGFCQSCNQNEKPLSPVNNIKIEMDGKNRDSLNTTITKIIRLDTANNSMIGWISTAKYLNNRYYILDNLRSKSFFIYDSTGSNIYKSAKGKGPGEVIDPFAFDISIDQSKIILYDQARSLINYYDLVGKFISSDSHPEVYIKDFCEVGKDSFLVYNSRNDPRPGQTRRFLTYTLYTDNFKNENYFDIYVTGDKISMDLIHPIERFGKETFFVAPWHYSIYSLKNGQVNTLYNLEFGEYGLSPRELEMSTEDIHQILDPGKKVGSLYSVFCNKDFLVFQCQAYPKFMTFFISLADHSVYCLNDCFNAGTLPYCKIWSINNEGQVFGMVEPSALINFKKTNHDLDSLQVEENDNPYVIIFNVTR